ncbi:aminoacyl--tRNA ligase-related protein [Pseudomonas sp. PB3P13]
MNQIKATLPPKIKNGRLSELLERIPYISESVKSVQYLESDHCALVDIDTDNFAERESISVDLEELVEALLVAKISPQKTVKAHARPANDTGAIHPEKSASHYDATDVLLMEAVDRLLLAIAVRHGAHVRDYASIYTAEIMERNGYHKNFPQNVYGVTQIPHNYTLIKDIRESRSSTIAPDLFQNHGAFLQPCVCYHCYAEIQQTRQSQTVFTMKGRCFRHEIQWRLNTFRRNEFTMREIVFMGSPAFVEEKRLEIMEEIWSLFCDLGLYGQIVTARDPFFHYDDMKTKGAIQLMADAKYELEFMSANGESSSIASFNNCQDTLCEKFEITNVDNHLLHSGCVAFGLDRWRAALYEQFGSDTDHWPNKLKP